MKKIIAIIMIFASLAIFSCGKDVEEIGENTWIIENILNNTGNIEEINIQIEENSWILEEENQVVVPVNEENSNLPVKEIIVDKWNEENLNTNDLEAELENLFDWLLNDLE